MARVIPCELWVGQAQVVCHYALPVRNSVLSGEWRTSKTVSGEGQFMGAKGACSGAEGRARPSMHA